jgi:hypothetical protein
VPLSAISSLHDDPASGAVTLRPSRRPEEASRRAPLDSASPAEQSGKQRAGTDKRVLLNRLVGRGRTSHPTCPRRIIEGRRGARRGGLAGGMTSAPALLSETATLPRTGDYAGATLVDQCLGRVSGVRRPRPSEGPRHPGAHPREGIGDNGEDALCLRGRTEAAIGADSRQVDCFVSKSARDLASNPKSPWYRNRKPL